MQGNIHGLKQTKAMLAALALAALLVSCGGEPDHTKVELADSIGGSSIVTAADLISFLENGESDTANLSADINLEGEMLRITKARDGLTIEGNGFTLSGTGDCVVRLDAGCTVKLNNITIHSGSDAIGCLGNAFIGGQGARLIGVGNGIRAVGEVTILAGSTIECEANVGMGMTASGLSLQKGAALSAQGPLGGVNVNGEIFIQTSGRLAAYTDENYNALKCSGALTMEDGSTLIAENRGDFHGAEITALEINGAVTIEAKGGKNSSGLFLFEQLNDITVIGSCEPKPRFESGKGSITFVDSAAQLPTAIASPPEPTPTPLGEGQ